MIAENMHEPRYVFKARATIDAKALEEKGFVVDIIGRKSPLAEADGLVGNGGQQEEVRRRRKHE